MHRLCNKHRFTGVIHMHAQRQPYYSFLCHILCLYLVATCMPLVPPQQHYDSISSHPLDAVLWKMTVIWLRWFEASGSLPLLGPWCTATLKWDWSVNVWLAIKWQSHTEGFFYRRACFVPNSSQSRLIQI